MNIKVHVLEAADFPEQTENQICAEIVLSGITELTSAVPISSPKWEDVWYLLTRDSDDDDLKVSLFSGDGVSAKNFIGTGHLSLKNFDQQNDINEWVQLTDQNGENAGRIHLRIEPNSELDAILNGLDDDYNITVPKTSTTDDPYADKNRKLPANQDSEDENQFQQLLDEFGRDDEDVQIENQDENQQIEGEETNQPETQNPEVSNLDDLHEEEETINVPPIEETRDQEENQNQAQEDYENQNEDQNGNPSENNEDDGVLHNEEEEAEDRFNPSNEEENEYEMDGENYLPTEEEDNENDDDQGKKLISHKTRQNALKENTLKLIIKANKYPDQNMKKVEKELNSEVSDIKNDIKTDSEQIYAEQVEKKFADEEGRKKWLLNTKLSENSNELEKLKERHNDPQKMSAGRIKKEIEELKKEIEDLDQKIQEAKAQLNEE